MQGNLAGTYRMLGRFEEALLMKRDVHTGCLKLYGEEDKETFREAGNYASLLNELKRFKETEALLRKAMPVARRVLGENHHLTLRLRLNYCAAACRLAFALD